MSNTYASSEVSELMTSDVETAFTYDSIKSAAVKMAERGIGALVIVDDENNVLGMLTERDVMSNVVAHNKDAEKTIVRDIMTAPAIGVQLESTLDQVIRKMVSYKFRRLPVLEGTKLSGMISQTDVLRSYPDIIASHSW